jgi:chaperonin GroES
MNSGGDVLARGAVTAQFGSGGADVTEEKWKAIFGADAKKPNVISDEERAIYDAAMDAAKALLPEEPVVAQVKIRPIQDRIIVQRVEAETKTTAGLYLADESKEKPAEGIVVAVGPGKYVNGELQKSSIQVGERVVFGKFSGAEVKVGLDILTVLREEDIFLVKE